MILRMPCEPACGACGACGKEKTLELNFQAGEVFAEGETVLLTGRVSQSMLAVLFAFVLPVTGMLAVAAAALALGWAEPLSALAVLLFLCIYFAALYIRRDSMGKRFELTVRKHYPL
jgi:positive regulator of sigma E activity